MGSDAQQDRDLSPALMRALYDATDGRPMQWRSLEGLDLPDTDEAVRYA